MNRLRNFGATLLVAVALIGCDSTSRDNGGTATAIAVVPTSATMLVGDIISITPAVTTSTGKAITGVAITWSSSDSTVVQVNASGRVTAVAPGEADITAAARALSAKAHIKVVAGTYALSVTRQGTGSGKIASAPAGIDCGTSCAAPFGANGTVLLTATPASDGSAFAGWGGACSGIAACRVTLSADTAVTATFNPPPPVTATLQVTITGAGSVTGPGDFSCASGSCSQKFAKGATVALTAAAGASSVFAGWGGACSSTSSCSVALDGDKSVSASFIAAHVVTLAVTGSGSVASSPAGLDCRAASGICSASFVAGTTVTLTRSADAGSFFNGWSGGAAACASAASCDLVVGADLTANAAFATGARLTLTVTGNGSVTSSPAGITCTAASSPCSDFFPTSTAVTLTASPGAGANLSRWVGGGCTSGACALTMSSDTAVTAVFDQQVALSVTVNGSGSVTSSPAGIQCASGTCQAGFDSGDTVVLVAFPANGSVFTGWTGDCSGAGSCSMTLDAPRTATANFAVLHTVSVTVTGSGTVTSTTPFINCASGSGTCSAVVKHGDPVSLTASPAASFFFGGWTGGGCGSLSTCSTNVTADLPITAAFNAGANLTVNVVGSGSVTSTPSSIACPGTCSAAFALGSSATLKETPSNGYYFYGWSGGACSGANSSCDAALTAPVTVTATFKALPVLSIDVTGSGTITSSPAGINCTAAGGTCSLALPSGTSVTLYESPGSSQQFGGWTGVCSSSGTSSNCPFTLTADTSISASFGTFYNLSMTVTGQGTVTAATGPVQSCGPSSGTCSGLYTVGSQVALTATPANGSALVGWGGGCASASGNQCTVTMSAAVSATATFSAVTNLAVAQGDLQSGPIDSLLPTSVVIKVTTTVGGNNVSGAQVTLTGPLGSAVTPNPATSDSLGRATFFVRLGRTPGKQTFAASAVTAPSMVSLSATAGLPTAGTIFTVVGTSHSPGFDGIPGSATVAHIKAPRGLALAGDGTLYISDYGNNVNNAIYALSPAGVLTIVAGNGPYGGSLGDGGPATAAQLNGPSDLALDETNGQRMLYVADYYNNKVRRIDLTQVPPTIDNFAGGGTATQGPGYGDAGPATAATLSGVTRISLGPDGYLYIGDRDRNRIRRVKLSNNVIDNWLTGNSYFCGVDDCSVAWDASKTPYVTRNDYYGAAIYRVNPDLSTTLVAGSGSSTANGVYATSASMGSPMGTIAFDAAGNMLYTDQSLAGPVVRRVDPATSHIVTIAGTGAAGYLGDYTPAAQAQLNAPRTSILDPAGNLIIADTANSAVRIFWGAGQSTKVSSTFSLSSGDQQSVMVDQITAPMAVQLLDPNGQPIQGYPITWKAIDPGGGLYATTSNTNTSGIATVQGRVGLAPGVSYRFSASAVDFYGKPLATSPITFTQNATVLPTGYMFTIIDTNHSSGLDGIPGPASLSHISGPRGLALAKDGTLYVSDGTSQTANLVYALSPAGVLSVVVGTPGAYGGFSGDGGPATSAQLNSPNDLSLDESNGRKMLYIADSTNNRIRVVDLNAVPPTIDTFAGGGSAPGPGYGDGGPAAGGTGNGVAQLALPMHVTVGPGDGYVYLSDVHGQTNGRIRRVNINTGIISAWLDGDYYFCSAGSACVVVFDSKGTPYVNRSLGYYCFGIYRVDNPSPMSLTLIAGGNAPGCNATTANTADGILATNAYISPGALFFDANDTLYLTDPFANLGAGTNRVRVLSDLTAKATITTVAGINQTTGSNGPDGATPTKIGLNNPLGVLVTPDGKIVVSDTANSCVREIWK